MTTQARIEAANQEMAAIAEDPCAADRRERMLSIWQPIACALIDTARSDNGAQALAAEPDPDFVGVTSDSGDRVYMHKAKASSGFVYRKFVIERRG